jgi:hypothetical protein
MTDFNHPKDEHGRYVCTREHPMPDNRPSGPGVRWSHPLSSETDADSDNYIEYRCKACGLVFRCEMPD